MIYLSHNYFIKKLLNLKEENIYFETECFSYKYIKNIKYKVISATLTYNVAVCACCNEENSDFSIIKNGFKIVNIKIPNILLKNLMCL